ncbi:hypothetical protein YWIDRAFT_07932 [Streptomyces sp. SceaMP-e96]|nr:hypothetical protein YWIDRAFT_07932 [Streptomyces sp. SceaMP-e96]
MKARDVAVHARFQIAFDWQHISESRIRVVRED